MNKNKSVLRNFALVTQLSLNIIVPAFLCLLIGMWLDRTFHVSYCAVVLLIFGVLGGGKSAYGIAMNSLKMDEKKQEKPEDIVAKYNREHGDEKNEKNIK